MMMIVGLWRQQLIKLRFLVKAAVALNIKQRREEREEINLDRTKNKTLGQYLTN